MRLLEIWHICVQACDFASAFGYTETLFIFCVVWLSEADHQKDKENLLGPQLSKEGCFNHLALPQITLMFASSVSLPSNV